MVSTRQKLSARTVATAKPGRHGDGAGLWLIVAPSGSKRWSFRFTWRGRVTETGLGGYPAISLAQAREKAVAARRLVATGVNPIHARRGSVKTFGEIALALIASKEHGWRNAKHREQWRQTLEVLAAPLWPMPIEKVALEDILGVLKPIWQATPETASRLRGRIEAVLDFAAVHKFRTGENPARWRGHLAHILPRRGKLSRGHFSAMPYIEVPGFMATLRQQQSVAGMALEFTILTAARTGEILGARWDVIDLAAGIWTIPAQRTKAAREHRVPLSGPAVAIIKRLDAARISEFVFLHQLSQTSMLKVLRRIGIDVTVHGFRSAFRDWCGNETSFPRELAEAALAHATGNATEQAYRRSDALERRRQLMEAWGRYIKTD